MYDVSCLLKSDLAGRKRGSGQLVDIGLHYLAAVHAFSHRAALTLGLIESQVQVLAGA